MSHAAGSLEHFLASQDMAKSTREVRRLYLSRYMSWLAEGSLEPLTASTGDILRFIELQRTLLKDSSVDGPVFYTLKAYYRWLHRIGLVRNNPMEHLTSPSSAKRNVPQFVTPEELRLILDATLNDKNWLLVALMAFHSLKITEVLSCAIEDVDFGQHRTVLQFTPVAGDLRLPYVVVTEQISVRLKRHIGLRTTGPIFTSRNNVQLSRGAASNVIISSANRAGLNRKVTAQMLTYTLPSVAIQRAFSYPSILHAIGIPHRKHSDRWIALLNDSTRSIAAERLTSMTLHRPDSHQSILTEIDALSGAGQLPDGLIVAMATAVLERAWFEAYSQLPEGNEKTRRDGNVSLYAHTFLRQGSLTPSDKRTVDSILGYRNDGAHGAFELVPPGTGERVIADVRKLLKKVPGLDF